jgi:hypothetical protein
MPVIAVVTGLLGELLCAMMTVAGADVMDDEPAALAAVTMHDTGPTSAETVWYVDAVAPGIATVLRSH